MRSRQSLERARVERDRGVQARATAAARGPGWRSPPGPAGFAQRLRELRNQSGMTSKALAAALEIDETRLSRFLNGTAPPPYSMQLPSRLHRLLGEMGVTPFSEADLRGSRDPHFAAVRAKGPVAAREYALQEAEEVNAEQHAQAARDLTALEDELRQERARQQQVEE
ncbi:helix-turn-helix domain-containing protein [Streptomyces sp. NPDC056486]|uniref:helix-turn-helix domain-containing protein n=1 Tax=Streptomyces sp. NPDC056486 TaxID=3345835 RepID=UPI0036840402